MKSHFSKVVTVSFPCLYRDRSAKIGEMTEIPCYGYIPNKNKVSVILNICGKKGQGIGAIQIIFLRNLDRVHVITFQF